MISRDRFAWLVLATVLCLSACTSTSPENLLVNTFKGWCKTASDKCTVHEP